MADVLYVIRHVPGDDAPSLRVAALVGLFQSVGYDVDLFSTSWSSNEPVMTDSRIAKTRLIQPLVGLSKVHKVWEHLTSHGAARSLVELCKKSSPKLILFYGGSVHLIEQVSKYAQENSIRLMVDETDWFDPRQVNNLYEKIYYCNDNIRIRAKDHNLDGQIAISPYFFDYLSSKGAKPFFLPPVFSVPTADHVISRPQEADVIRIVYAGSIGPDKDIIGPFIEVVRIFNQRGCTKAVELHLVGPEWSDYEILEPNGSEQDYLLSGIFFHGRLQHERAVAVVQNSDLSVLFRRPQRYAKAGFSTKFAESMLYGTPVICNRVGGADSVLNNWVDGIVIADTSNETLTTVLDQVVGMSRSDLDQMKAAAQRSAYQLFDVENYMESFDRYIRTVLNEC